MILQHFTICSLHLAVTLRWAPSKMSRKKREIGRGTGHSPIYLVPSTRHFMISPSRALSYHPSIHWPSPPSTGIWVRLRATGLSAASRPAGPVLCQISTQVWSSSDTSSVYRGAPVLLPFSWLLSSPPSSCLVVFSSHSLPPPEGDYHLLA